MSRLMCDLSRLSTPTRVLRVVRHPKGHVQWRCLKGRDEGGRHMVGIAEMKPTCVHHHREFAGQRFPLDLMVDHRTRIPKRKTACSCPRPRSRKTACLFCSSDGYWGLSLHSLLIRRKLTQSEPLATTSDRAVREAKYRCFSQHVILRGGAVFGMFCPVING